MVGRKPRSLSPATTARGGNRNAGGANTIDRSPATRTQSDNNDGRNKQRGHGRGRSHSPVRHQLTDKSVPLSPVIIKGPPNLMDHGYGNLPLSAIEEHVDDKDFLEQVKRCIPSEFMLIASQDDFSKAQEDHFAMDHFQLKPPDGHARWKNSELAGSVATCALLQLMYENPKAMVANGAVGDREDDTSYSKPWSALEIVQELQQRIKTCSKQDASPTVSYSRPLGPPLLDDDQYAPYYIVPPNYIDGTRRALLIGCVSGGDNTLKGTLNDVYNIRHFLVTHCGFLEENIVMLQESIKAPAEEQPTKKNIAQGFNNIVRDSKPGDVNFIQFSGHGNRTDTNLYILPCDFKENGYIQDDKILKNLIKAMPSGVYTTMLVDCCYSGTICDLPYILKSSSTEQEIEGHFDTSISKKQQQKNNTTACGGPPPTVRARRMPRQSVKSFYNIDTLEETLEKEATGGEEYKKMEEARKQKQTWLQFEPIKLVDFNKAKSMARKTKKGFIKGVGGVFMSVQNATEMAIEGTAKASDNAFDAAKKVSSRLGRSLSPGPRRHAGDDDTKNSSNHMSNNNKKSHLDDMPSSPGKKRNPASPSKTKTVTPARGRPKSLVRPVNNALASPSKKVAEPVTAKLPAGLPLNDIPAPTKKATALAQKKSPAISSQTKHAQVAASKEHSQPSIPRAALPIIPKISLPIRKGNVDMDEDDDSAGFEEAANRAAMERSERSESSRREEKSEPLAAVKLTTKEKADARAAAKEHKFAVAMNNTKGNINDGAKAKETRNRSKSADPSKSRNRSKSASARADPDFDWKQHATDDASTFPNNAMRGRSKSPRKSRSKSPARVRT